MKFLRAELMNTSMTRGLGDESVTQDRFCLILEWTCGKCYVVLRMIASPVGIGRERQGKALVVKNAMG